MRIACLQFAPQVGDVDNNLNRADAVLSKANPEDLDLLVLPELAFTGYNFKSLQQISPFLEPQGSGISALWGRTVALKYNCVVTVGYPEKVDVKPKWPTSPEYYNSVIVIDSEGSTIANYRKNFLYYTDETWALEGQDGFFEGFIPGLGNTSMGICMDLKSPYKFEAPWHAFEFAFHVLEMESNLVILTMAWLTREDGRMFSRMPKEPDMDTITYWITRLEPLIRSDNDDEIIVVFCNRTGIEDDAVYAGTSAVIGIKDGEVSVYGMLGRGDKELLVVDTDAAPYAKLVYRPDEGASVVASTDDDSKDNSSNTSKKPGGNESSEKSPKPPSTGGSDSNNTPTSQSSRNAGPSENIKQPALPISPLSETMLASHKAASSGGVTREYDYVPLGRGPRAGSDRSTKSIQGSVSSRHSANSKASRDSTRSKSRARSSKEAASSKASASHRSSSRKTKPVSPPIQIPPSNQASDTIPTPTGPSPTPLAIRPKLIIPKDAHRRPPVQHIPTPYPSSGRASQGRMYGANSILQQNTIPTPITAFDDVSPQSPNKFFWIPSDTLLQTPGPRMWTPALADSPTLEMRTAVPRQSYVENTAKARNQPTVPQSVEQRNPRSTRSRNTSKPRADATGSEGSQSKQISKGNERVPVRPSSPKPRNTSRPRNADRPDPALGQRSDLAAIAQRLESISPRPNSAAGQRAETFSPRPGSSLAQRTDGHDKAVNDIPDRPSSPKSRNASRTRPADPGLADDSVDQRQTNLSRASILIGASPSILDGPVARGPSAMYRPDSRMSNVEPIYRPMSRAAHSRSNSASLGYRTQTLAIAEASGSRPESRAVSRGRQRAPKEVNGASNYAPINARDCSIPARRPSAPSFGFRSPAEFEAEIKRVSPEWTAQGSHRGSYGSGDDDEIVEEIIVRRSPSCAVHGDRRNQSVPPGQEPNAAVKPVDEKGEKSPRATPESEGSAKIKTTVIESVQTNNGETEPSSETYASSVETAATIEGSPATPSFLFNPKTPKAMVLIRDDDYSIPTTPLSAPFVTQLKLAKCLGQEAIGKAMIRPKSAVW
ncbi:hypothetical protein AAE478_004441 [Parahypoxylon ruwenzoriense]